MAERGNTASVLEHSAGYVLLCHGSNIINTLLQPPFIFKRKENGGKRNKIRISTSGHEDWQTLLWIRAASRVCDQQLVQDSDSQVSIISLRYDCLEQEQQRQGSPSMLSRPECGRLQEQSSNI